MTEPLTLIKLIILYMLNQVEFPLKKSQMFDFILDKEYTNYFTLMQAYNELVESNLIEITSTHSTTFMAITSEGLGTLKYFSSKMSEGIKKDIEQYFLENKVEIHNEVSVVSNYYRTPNGDYVADLIAKEKNEDIMEVKIYMPTEEAAETICNNFKDKSSDVYAYILENLLV